MNQVTALRSARTAGIQQWLLLLLMLMSLVFAGPVAAKRVNGGLVGGIVPTPLLPGAAVPGQFDITGFIQEATLDTAFTLCPTLPVKDPRLAGGTVKLNGQIITVPCNTILQMPAFALTWADLYTMAPPDLFPPGAGGAKQSGLALTDTLGTGGVVPLGSLTNPATFQPKGYNGALPSHEIHIQGNIVNGRFIAGLIFISQQSLNGGQGVISCIDYPTGELQINGPALPAAYTTDGKCAPPTATTTRVRMNDPIGRYGIVHGGTGCLAAGTCDVEEPGFDPRYTADTDNPTMHSALGFPICIPAFGPPGTANSDALCPMYNRPVADAGGLCPSFPAASLLPAFGATTPGDYCRTWVMDLPGAHALNPAKSDPTLSAPLVIGDIVSFHGTLKSDAVGPYISAHTIEANLGIYTQPHSKPSYVAMEEVLVGTGGALSVAGLAVETTNKVSWVGFASDVTELVDMYAVHQDPVNGNTTEFYLGTQDPCCTPLGRFRTPANNLGAFGDPQRNYRAVSRNACQPDTTVANVDPATGLLKDPRSGLILTQLQTACHMDPLSFVPTGGAISGATQRVVNPTTGVDNIKSTSGLMLNQNGLVPGQYTLPNFDFIFAENLNFGTPLVPNNFQDLPFLFCGSGPLGGPGSGTTVVGQLDPAPWAAPMTDPVFHGTLCPSAKSVAAAGTQGVVTTPAVPVPPVINFFSATPASTVVGRLTTVTLSVGATNPNGTGAMTYQFTNPSPSTITMPGTTVANPVVTQAGSTITATFNPTAVGTLTFKVTVFNGVGTGTTATVPVVIAASTAKAPTLKSFVGSPTSVNGGATVTLTAIGNSNPTGSRVSFVFKQTGGPAVTISPITVTGTAPNDQTGKATFVAPFLTTAQNLTFQATVVDTATGLTTAGGTTQVTIKVNATAGDVVTITGAAWIANRNISGTLLNVGKTQVTAVSTKNPAPIGMTMTAFISNSTLPNNVPGSTALPIAIPMTLQPADAAAPTPVCGATPCWIGAQLGTIDNLVGDNIAPFTITVKSSFGGTASMLIGDPLYAIKCIAPSPLVATFNPTTGVCTAQ